MTGPVVSHHVNLDADFQLQWSDNLYRYLKRKELIGRIREDGASSLKYNVQWNLNLTKCQGTGPIGSLYRGFVISKTLI